LIAPSSSSAPGGAERTEVYYGAQNVVDAELRFFFKSKRRIDTCMNSTRPSLAIGIESIKKSFVDAKSRGVKLRYLTEITKDNIDYCKELMKIVDEFKHLEGIRSNFMLSESEYLAPVVSNDDVGKTASEIIYSNIRSFVDQQQYFFDMLWNKAIPAEQKIRESEEGIELVRTRIIENQQEIIAQIRNLNNAANKLSICTSFGGMQMSYNYLFDTYKNLIEKHRKGNSKDGLRWLMNIDNKESISLVRIFLESGIQIRHVKSMPPLNFGVSDKEVATTIEKMIGGKKSNSFLISNEPLYVSHFSSLFDELWKDGIDAAERIKEIEERIEPEFIEVITDREKASHILLDLAKSVKDEALSLMPTARGMLRMDKLGVVDHLIKASQRRCEVKIICPLTEENSEIVKRISEQAPDIRIMDGCGEAGSGILIADNEKFLQAEVKDPMSDQFSNAIGFAIYSNSKRNVNSFKTFFDLLWKERLINEELKKADMMQKEFINIAAHEIRTPIQPILGLSEVLKSKEGDIKQYNELIDTINRNAKRLQRLTENILDVTRIEGHALKLNKEQFDLKENIYSVVKDIISQIKENDDVKISFIESENAFFVEADRTRMYQVISNLITNSVKFTQRGNITITAEIIKDNNDDNRQVVIVKVRDTGISIDPEILPNLFTKFATKSFEGTGLGLFISKKIIEAHGGKIWAENNADGKGATFSFSLPINNKI